MELEVWLRIPVIRILWRKEDVKRKILSSVSWYIVGVYGIVIGVVVTPVQKVELKLEHDRFLVKRAWLPGDGGEVGVCSVDGKGINAEDAHHALHTLWSLSSPEGDVCGECVVRVGVVLDDEVVVGLELDGGHGE